MKRIAIIGPPGAGKTTLAKELNRIHDIKIYHLDRIFWKRQWKEIHQDNRMDILQKLIGEKQWIIEGFYCNISQPRLDAADTIIFLDLPSALCLHRLRMRNRQQYEHSRRRDIPLECTDKLDLKLVQRVLAFPFQERISLYRLLKTYGKTKSIFHLRSPEAVATFLTQQEQLVKGETQYARIPESSVRGAEQWQPTPALSSSTISGMRSVGSSIILAISHFLLSPLRQVLLAMRLDSV